MNGYSEVLFSHKDEGNDVISRKMDRTGKHYIN